MTEQEFFTNMVRLLEQDTDLKASIKALVDNGKEADLDVKTLKATAALYVKNNYEEKSEEFAKIKEAYDRLAD